MSYSVPNLTLQELLRKYNIDTNHSIFTKEYFVLIHDKNETITEQEIYDHFISINNYWGSDALSLVICKDEFGGLFAIDLLTYYNSSPFTVCNNKIKTSLYNARCGDKILYLLDNFEHKLALSIQTFDLWLKNYFYDHFPEEKL